MREAKSSEFYVQEGVYRRKEQIANTSTEREILFVVDELAGADGAGESSLVLGVEGEEAEPPLRLQVGGDDSAAAVRARSWRHLAPQHPLLLIANEEQTHGF